MLTLLQNNETSEAFNECYILQMFLFKWQITNGENMNVNIITVKQAKLYFSCWYEPVPASALLQAVTNTRHVLVKASIYDTWMNKKIEMGFEGITYSEFKEVCSTES